MFNYLYDLIKITYLFIIHLIVFYEKSKINNYNFILKKI